MTDFVEYRFRIPELRRETLPMVRLAAYMAEVARLLGSTESVHFDRIEDTSLALVQYVAQESRPLVSPRVRAASRGEGPPDAINAWRRINTNLTEDNATAEMTLPGGEIICFPGVPKPERPIGPIRQPTSIQGRLIRLEGSGDKVWVGIDDESGLAGSISISAERAKALAQHWHEHVRITGMGRWRREKEGRWVLQALDGDNFELLDDEPLADVLRRLREFVPPGTAGPAIGRINDLRGE